MVQSLISGCGTAPRQARFTFALKTTAVEMLLAIVVAIAINLTIANPVSAAANSPVVTLASGGGGVPVVNGYFNNAEGIGYEVTEFFLAGNAASYTTTLPLTTDGKWTTIAQNPLSAAYVTRVVVHKPKQKKRFNGTVYVEWLNVSGASDVSPDWVQGHLEVARQGAAYVLVSAQFAGVNALKGNSPVVPGDPVRYASLNHPGDSYSYDIFSQAGQAIWDGAVLGDWKPRRLIALGESQSAGRMTTYINAVHPLVDVYDGFFVHSRNAGGAALSQAPQAAIPVALTDIRTDIKTPVLVFQAESDVANSLLLARQPETAKGNYRLWEVAGTAHFDAYGLNIGTVDVGDGSGEVANFAAMRNPSTTPIPGVIQCAKGINAGPMHWVLNAALHQLDRWVTRDTPPAIAPRFEATSAPGTPVVFATDEHGNTLGGIRTPLVDVPIATLTGTGNTAAPGAPPQSFFCILFGQTIPFDNAKLATLYPNQASFVFSYLFSSLKAVQSQYLLWPDALLLLRAAEQSGVGKPQ